MFRLLRIFKKDKEREEIQTRPKPELIELGNIWIDPIVTGTSPKKKYLLVQDHEDKYHLILGIVTLHLYLHTPYKKKIKAVHGGGQWKIHNDNLVLFGISTEYKWVNATLLEELFPQLIRKTTDILIPNFTEKWKEIALELHKNARDQWNPYI